MGFFTSNVVSLNGIKLKLGFKMLEKEKIRSAILQELEQQLEVMSKSVSAAQEATTHSESKSEGKYDTRAIESGYLAGAQGARLQSLKSKVALCKKMSFRDFKESDEIGVTALVETKVDTLDLSTWYFLLSHVGGFSITVDGIQISVITTDSVAGLELVSLQVGDNFSFGNKSGTIKSIF